MTLSKDDRKRLLAVKRYRNARDPLMHMQPGDVQSAYLDSMARYRLVEGPNRSGKTTVVIARQARIARGLDPRYPFKRPIRLLFLTKQRLQAAQVIGRKLFDASELPGEMNPFPFIPKWEIAELGKLKVGFHVPYYCKLKNGNELFFKWSDSIDTQDAIKGMKLDGVHLDEDAGTLSLLHELYVRLADSRSEYPDFGGWIDWSATPEISAEALNEFRKQAASQNREYFRVLLPRGDHKAISEETVTALAEQLGEMAAVKVFGDKTAADVYSAYGDQWDDRRHMLAQDYIPGGDDNLFIGYDPGVDHASGMMVAAVTKDQPTQLKVVKYWSHRKRTITQEIRDLKEWLGGRRVTWVVYDTAAKNNDKVGTSTLGHMIRLMQEEGIAPICGYRQSQKKHEPGIQLLRHYLNPQPDDRSVVPLVKINPSTESGGGMVREQMMRIQARRKRRHAGDSLLIRGEDEAADCLRYIAMSRPAWNPDWRCGDARGVIRSAEGVLVMPVQPERDLTAEEAHWKRLFELSAKAARLRSKRRLAF